MIIIYICKLYIQIKWWAKKFYNFAGAHYFTKFIKISLLPKIIEVMILVIIYCSHKKRKILFTRGNYKFSIFGPPCNKVTLLYESLFNDSMLLFKGSFKYYVAVEFRNDLQVCVRKTKQIHYVIGFDLNLLNEVDPINN